MATNLTEKEAYEAMFAFLEQLKSNDIGGLLGEMCFLADGSPADPAVWDDWLQCVSKTKQGEVDAYLRIGNID